MRKLWPFIQWGIACQVVGVIIASLAWPGTAIDTDYGSLSTAGEMVATGNDFLVLVGIGAINIGVMLVLIFVIGLAS